MQARYRVTEEFLFKLISLLLPVIFFFCGTPQAVGTEPASMLTEWGEKVHKANCWPEYPRPQMRRPEWLNLNGIWKFAVSSEDASQPTEFNQEVLVPFPVESQLSRLQIRPEPSSKLWYLRTFEIPEQWDGKQIWLHFGAVDWRCEVWINSQQIGTHVGGYDPFSFDITDALIPDSKNHLVVAVKDPTDDGFQIKGKQRRLPKGIWYTPVSGIWQTVWLEPTPSSAIRSIKVLPDSEANSVSITLQSTNPHPDASVEVNASLDGKVVSSSVFGIDEPIELSIQDAQYWSPSSPVLYDLTIRLMQDEQVVDQVESYFGLRSVTIAPDRNGLNRIMLNGEPTFQYGPLDQGYWPDGLYTPPSDEAIRSELQLIKDLGFNLVRKHVKVEPARWYYWCDKIGLLVWQDMPNDYPKAPWPVDGVEIKRPGRSAKQFSHELQAMIDSLFNHPSIIVWIPFNQGWGQFETKRVTQWVKKYDPSRLVISASGGNDFGVGDVNADTFYPGPGAPPAEANRAAALSEFGGFGLPIRGHLWRQDSNWGYRNLRTREEFTKVYLEAMKKLRPLIESHLSAAVYTQITDVEIEVNGLQTYDRRVLKLDESMLKEEHAKLYESIPCLSEEQKVDANTLAKWTFEELVPGERVANVDDHMGAVAAEDVSGHNNHLYAMSRLNTPIAVRTSKQHGSAAQATSEMCLDFGIPLASRAEVPFLVTLPKLAGTHMDVLDHYPFTQWTIEASFLLRDSRDSQVLMAEEGSVATDNQPPFQFGVFFKEERNTAHLELQLIDAEDRQITVTGNTPLVADRWYHAAAVYDGENIFLYLRQEKESTFSLVGNTSSSNVMKLNNGTWVLGRGFDGAEGDYEYQGLIDDVRISTVALNKSRFMARTRPKD